MQGRVCTAIWIPSLSGRSGCATSRNSTGTLTSHGLGAGSATPGLRKELMHVLLRLRASAEEAFEFGKRAAVQCCSSFCCGVAATPGRSGLRRLIRQRARTRTRGACGRRWSAGSAPLQAPAPQRGRPGGLLTRRLPADRCLSCCTLQFFAHPQSVCFDMRPTLCTGKCKGSGGALESHP